MLRSSDHLTPDQQADLIDLALERVGDELQSGAVASVTPEATSSIGGQRLGYGADPRPQVQHVMRPYAR